MAIELNTRKVINTNENTDKIFPSIYCDVFNNKILHLYNYR